MERVWGGRRLAERFGKQLPPQATIGESWELVDRSDTQSVVRDGPLTGATLHELWTAQRREIFGERALAIDRPRFPLLIKLLDACQTLSLQVHPPPELAAELGGEPKNEVWYIADTADGAHLYLGLRAGVTRASFEQHLRAGDDVSALLQRVTIRAGDAAFIPGGRVHAIGAGCLIVEVQQNSDTTYRAFDFNRAGLDGRPRELHVEESLRSIDWGDIEPALEPAPTDGETVIDNDDFVVRRWALDAPRPAAPTGSCAVVCVLTGMVTCGGAGFGRGDFFLVPAELSDRTLTPGDSGAELLQIGLPQR
ncbi:MAG: mannose-6-phosphate isomerase [Solirubrobacterales bacterium]|nr:MAG: mannose-6-phosphate isomerase [Solirubrobacterales bacterium]